METTQSKKAFREEVKRLASGDSDSLVDFFDGLRQLSSRFGTVKVARVEPAVKLTIGAESATILSISGHTDRLTMEEVRRYAENRDGDNAVNACVYDLFDDAWRVANGQKIEGKVSVNLV